jgi:hypothetical protein
MEVFYWRKFMNYARPKVQPRFGSWCFNALLAVLVSLAAFAASASAQVTTGSVRGTVMDTSGAVVAGAKVTISDPKTQTTQTTQSNDSGEFSFTNLLAGDYMIMVEATNFKPTTLSDVRISINRTLDLQVMVMAGGAGEIVEVSAGGAELVETTTSTLSKSFNSRQIVDLSQTAAPAGVGVSGIYNLALTAGNVSSGGGVGVGVGGSIGGQRPRNNNFTVDGIDNNDKAVTGPQIYISPETVNELSVLTNQFSAEFSRSNGGQFIAVTKSGTNEFHGSAYGFFLNRRLNALDVQQKLQGFTRETNPRLDSGRYGFNVAGPIVKDKLFFFGSFERQQLGQAATPASVQGFTAAGLAQLAAIPGLSPTNLGIIQQFLPTAPVQGVNDDGTPMTVTVQGVSLPIGQLNFAAPNFQTQRNVVANFDFNQSEKMTHRVRFIFNRIRAIDNTADLPAFFTSTPNDGRLFSYTNVYSFSPRLANEFRFSFRRSVSNTPVPNVPFSGLDVFPNLTFQDLAVNIGPNPNGPQSGVENNYQFINNVTYTIGNHTLKFGGDVRQNIAPQVFVQRSRGDYNYNSVETFLLDQAPDGIIAQRSVGVSPFAGNQKSFFGFAQDDWRVTRNLTLNLGLRYSYQQLPFTARRQDLNAAASVPGLLEFRSPEPDKNNFAPVVGLAYAPDFKSGLLNKVFGGSGQTAIRAGFSLGYDVVFDNLFLNALPPQFNSTRDANIGAGTGNFLATGGILPNGAVPSQGLAPTLGTGVTDPATLRRITSNFIPDQQVPYSITYTLGIQRQFLNDYSLEVRYVGTRGVRLLTQNRINVQPIVNASNALPTFLTDPGQGVVDSLTNSRAMLETNIAQRIISPAFRNAGFTNPITAFLSNGNSSYNGLSVTVQKRLSKGLFFTASYTYSHLIDDSTAELFTTVFSPRRPQDFQSLRGERASSALDSRQRLSITGSYDIPYFTKSDNKLSRILLGGFSLTGTATFEDGKPFTPLSGQDANLNNDAAGDRTIFNSNGRANSVSAVRALFTSAASPLGAGQVVGYVAVDPNAQFIQAGRGTLATAGRNTHRLPGIQNFDFGVFKSFSFSETMKIQFRVDFFNLFNHAQFTPGSVNSVNPVQTQGQSAVNVNQVSFTSGLQRDPQNPLRGIGVNNPDFNRPEQNLSSNPRIIQLALRFNF